MAMLPTFNNRKIAKTIAAVGRAQRLNPSFDIARALSLAARLEEAIRQERTDEATFALCALLIKGMGISGPRELADLLHE